MPVRRDFPPDRLTKQSCGMISLCKWLLGMPVRSSLPTGIPSSHSQRLIIPDDVLIQFDLLMMSNVMLETCREMKWINKHKKKCIRLVINNNLLRHYYDAEGDCSVSRPALCPALSSRTGGRGKSSRLSNPWPTHCYEFFLLGSVCDRNIRRGCLSLSFCVT